MQREALYVISSLGRDRFIWATSAAEARAKAAPPASVRAETTPHVTVIGGAPAASGEWRIRHAHADA